MRISNFIIYTYYVNIQFYLVIIRTENRICELNKDSKDNKVSKDRRDRKDRRGFKGNYDGLEKGCACLYSNSKELNFQAQSVGYSLPFAAI